MLARLVELSPPPDAEIAVDTALEDPAELAEWPRDIVEVYLGVFGNK